MPTTILTNQLLPQGIPFPSVPMPPSGLDPAARKYAQEMQTYLNALNKAIHSFYISIIQAVQTRPMVALSTQIPSDRQACRMFWATDNDTLYIDDGTNIDVVVSGSFIFRGQVTITDTNSSASVTLPASPALPDNAYLLAATASGYTGSPASSALTAASPFVIVNTVK